MRHVTNSTRVTAAIVPSTGQPGTHNCEAVHCAGRTSTARLGLKGVKAVYPQVRHVLGNADRCERRQQKANGDLVVTGTRHPRNEFFERRG